MKIKSVKLMRVKIPLKHPFSTQLQHVTERESILMLIKDSEGREGLGESVAFSTPWYTEETVDTVESILKKVLIPELFTSFTTPEEWVTNSSAIKGNKMAIATVEMALWDLYAKQQQLSFRTLIGSEKSEVEAGIVVTWQTIEELREKVKQAEQVGYRRIKIKITPSNHPSELSKVISDFPRLVFLADANGSFSNVSSERYVAFDQIGFHWIEQPFKEKDWQKSRWAHTQLKTPILLDESICSLADVQDVTELQLASGIVLKPGRVGGYLPSRQIIEWCQQHQLAVYIGGMIEFGISKAFNLAIASLKGVNIPGDFSESHHFWHQDIIDEPFLVEHGKMRVPDAYGIGVTLHPFILQQAIVSTYHVES